MTEQKLNPKQQAALESIRAGDRYATGHAAATLRALERRGLIEFRGWGLPARSGEKMRQIWLMLEVIDED